MSELKEHLFVPYSELQEGDELTDAITIAKSYYLKSEADKVIAEKDKEIERLNDKALQYKVLDKEHCRDLNTQERRFALQMAHHKYKRCLAMAEMCEARYDEEDAKVNGCGASWEYISKEIKYWERWQLRWLELAEKFKETK